LTFNCQT